MNRKDLINQTEGAFLRKNYLEAFVIQSAYIESILKEVIERKFREHLSPGMCERCDFMNAVKGRLLGSSLSDSVKILFDSNYINRQEQKALDNYRVKRNRILHGLLNQISTTEFDTELRDVYIAGKKVLENKKIINAEELIDAKDEDNLFMCNINEGLFDIVPNSIKKSLINSSKRLSIDNQQGGCVNVRFSNIPPRVIIEMQSGLKPDKFIYSWSSKRIKFVFNDKQFDAYKDDVESWGEAISYAKKMRIDITKQDIQTGLNPRGIEKASNVEDSK